MNRTIVIAGHDEALNVSTPTRSNMYLEKSELLPAFFIIGTTTSLSSAVHQDYTWTRVYQLTSTQPPNKPSEVVEG